ncbi:hypothetical protein HDU87_002799 [Geranomyces variabilis]|uniref:LIM zinc-binding domain-containing protein n=1 Tax=Geranomyces variabilis TaxID=109894 RepID=A0AAD5TN80_9FUNG|nr:hypothetical protein HDU87_002799 [Geranomyces variabilis]
MDELDDLLCELQEFAAPSGEPPPLTDDSDHHSSKNDNTANNNADDDDHHDDDGIDPVAAASGSLVPSATPCFACNRPISGASLLALGDRSFHQDCFRCCNDTCKRRLAGLPYFEMFPDVYCEGCYHEKFGKRCAYCEQPIKERLISALGKSFHPEHFFCCQCGKTFGVDEQFMEADGMPYCPEDFMALFAYGCSKCKKPLVGDYITATGKRFHRECFGCMACKRPLATDGFFEHDGNPYCERDYHILTAPKCATCDGPLIGRAVNACGKRYHPECFQCCFCKIELELPTVEPGWGGPTKGKQGFRAKDQNPYCHPCFLKLYA